MDNHFHLILRQEGTSAVTKPMHSLMTAFVRRMNTKYGQVGRLFQARYQAKLVHDEGYLVYLSRYIHLNPHPFADFKTYKWSSYKQYVGIGNGICNPGSVLDCFGGSKTSYAIYCEKAVKPGLLAKH